MALNITNNSLELRVVCSVCGFGLVQNCIWLYGDIFVEIFHFENLSGDFLKLVEDIAFY